MQVVINIPDDEYNAICNNTFDTDGYFKMNLSNAFKNGTPLPKRHGALKDMGNLKYVFDLTREEPIYSGKDVEWAIKTMTTIIEADKEVDE